MYFLNAVLCSLDCPEVQVITQYVHQIWSKAKRMIVIMLHLIPQYVYVLSKLNFINKF
jgi:hypothetical protein